MASKHLRPDIAPPTDAADPLIAQLRAVDQLSAEQVQALEQVLTRHYKEPVRPVSQYCNAFRAWGQAISEKLKEAEGQEGHQAEYDRDYWGPVAEALMTLQIPIAKSNLLFRLIYLGEPLRRRKCPEHQGHWSGYYDPREGTCEHGCCSGYDITGWLPEDGTSSEPTQNVTSSEQLDIR